VKKLVDGMVGEFLKLYEDPYFPFNSLSQRAEQLGLNQITSLTGEQVLINAVSSQSSITNFQWLIAQNIDPRFAREILQVATRVNYASNLAYIHGLETLVRLRLCRSPSLKTN
jgi:prenylcysteine oxidase/farnesylcysteine lyase